MMSCEHIDEISEVERDFLAMDEREQDRAWSSFCRELNLIEEACHVVCGVGGEGE